MRKRKSPRGLQLFVLLALGGCVRTAIPPHFSELQSGLAGRPSAASPALARLGTQGTALLVRNEPAAEPDETIGHQYMLFFLPLTSVYFSGGVAREVDEVLLDELLERGNLVFSATAQDALALQSLPHAPPAFSARLRSPRLNAYDAFFFRILTVSGELELREHADGAPASALIKPVSDRSYRKFAYGPLLSYQFHKTLRATLDALFTKREEEGRYLGPRRTRRKAAAAEGAAARPVVIVLRPSLRTALPPDFGQRLSDSFGYPNSLPYPEESVRRIIQEGLRESAPSEAAIFDAATSDRSSVALAAAKGSFGASPWVLETDAEIELSAPDGKTPDALVARAELRVFEIAGGRSLLLFRRLCHAEEPLREHEEGGSVIALRRAAASMAELVFRGRTEAAKVGCDPAE